MDAGNVINAGNVTNGDEICAGSRNSIGSGIKFSIKLFGDDPQNSVARELVENTSARLLQSCFSRVPFCGTKDATNGTIWRRNKTSIEIALDTLESKTNGGLLT